MCNCLRFFLLAFTFHFIVKSTYFFQKTIDRFSKNDRSFFLNLPYLYAKTTTLCTQKCRTFALKVPQFHPVTMALLWLNYHSFYSHIARKSRLQWYAKHLPIYTILPCLRYPIVRQTMIGCEGCSSIRWKALCRYKNYIIQNKFITHLIIIALFRKKTYLCKIKMKRVKCFIFGYLPLNLDVRNT